ncbi:MAG: protease modulator HflC [Mariprofundaceae bacterium]|nr:protease modulator HflC [Mariprofundaceae bacterium]
MGTKQTFGLILVVAVVFVLNMSAFVVGQRDQALVLQFGNPLRVVKDAGLHFKMPWQAVAHFDRRLLVQDAPPNEVITMDKKTILVDAYTRWRIVDPLKVFQVAGSENGVAARMEDIIRSKIRNVLGRHTLLEIVSGGKDANLRVKLMHDITKQADNNVRNMGIRIADVRIKRADLPQENSNAVFKRMKAERQRIATQYRSQGAEAGTEIRAEADKERKILLADAYKQSEILRGKADAKITRIYAQAYNKDAKFYAFTRSLQAYRDSLGKGTKLVITPDSEFFRFFEHSGK